MPHINHRRGETRRSVNRETRCSCYMCGNPRKWWNQRTLGETLADLDEKDQLDERPARRRTKSKSAQKDYLIQKRDSWARGGLLEGWYPHRRYLTKKSAKAALASLRGSARVVRGRGRLVEYRLVSKDASGVAV
jgi:hypothetical protein